MSDLTIIRKPPRWFSWRDVVSLLLGVTVLLLAVQVNSLSEELGKRPTAEQFDALTRQTEAKDARIKQLTDLLVLNRIPVPPEPVLTPSPSPTPVMPGLTPSPPGPSPHPRPGRSSSPRPRPTRTSASPNPACVVVLAGTCITPPPTPNLPPFLR